MNETILVIIVISIILYFYYNTRPVVKEHFIIINIKEKLCLLNKHFEKLDIREGSSSYTEDKSTIYLCLRDERGNYYSQNTVMYVVLHEIAHILNKDNYGHTPEFHAIFNKLLCRAADIGIYDPHQPHDDWYCGVDISQIEMPKCNILDDVPIENIAL